MKTTFIKITALLLLAVTLLIPLLTACGKGNNHPASEPCEHNYDNACDAICNLCGATREVRGHRYFTDCDTDCNGCGEVREVEPHTDADYDDKCDKCDTPLPAHAHAYDDGCDPDCNLCGAVRTDIHTYYADCDPDCNDCGATREAAEHPDEDENHVCDGCGAELAPGFDLPEVPAVTVPVFDPSAVPTFDNSAEYIELNGNTPYFSPSQLVTDSYAYYSEQDALGRSGVAVACLGRELFPDSGRGSLPDPTGWHSGSVYERCHLIAHSLAGCDAANNLITGTYDLNTVMQSFEQMVKDYIVETDNHVMYRVTPVFEGNNLVASGVILEGWSVEDEGAGICFNIYIYNEQDDEIINHATGEVTLPERNYTFVVNKSNWKIHRPTCSSVADMKDENKMYWYGTYEELIEYLTAEGKISDKTNCGNCKPQNA